MSISNNVATIVKNTASATTGLLSVTSGLVLDATNLAVGSIDSVPGVLRAVVDLPKNTTAGYIAEDRGISIEDARRITQEKFNISASEAIASGSEAMGRVAARIAKEMAEA